MNTLKNIKISSILRGKAPLASSVFAGAMIAFCLLGIVMPRATNADFNNTTNALYVAKTLKVVITAYSSTPDQTDDTPFITASGKHVADGIIANNMLPIGTKIKIPGLYGDKIFVVEDRMASYKSKYHFDIWMPDRTSAINFGVKTAEIEVL
jgi:3D (Asp-Asp-Asp) domain-containing protein